MAALQLAVTQLLQAATNASGADAVAAAREAAEAAAEAAGVPRRAASERMSPAHSLHKLQLLHEMDRQRSLQFRGKVQGICPRSVPLLLVLFGGLGVVHSVVPGVLLGLVVFRPPLLLLLVLLDLLL